MSSDIVNQLVLVRNACRQLGTIAPAPLDTITPIRDVLDRMIAEYGPIEHIRTQAAHNLMELGDPKTTDISYEGASRSVADRLSTLDMKDPAARTTVQDILKADGAHWQACEEAIAIELKGSRDEASREERSPDEPIDREALAIFINQRITGEGSVTVETVRVASEGTSKITLFVTLTGTATLPSDIVLRMDRPFNFLGTTVIDEYEALQMLHAHGAPVPELYALEECGAVLGFPFLLVERLSGTNLGKRYYPPERDDVTLKSIARALAAIHSVPLESGSKIGADYGGEHAYVALEIEKYHADWKATGASCPTIDAGFVWIRANIAAAYGVLTVVHNDFDYHNIIIERNQVTGVVDWEFVHIGNPVADIGYFQDSADKGAGLDWFIDQYVLAGGRRPGKEELDFYIIWGHMRLAIMAFQVETGCRNGDFQDIRYAMAGVYMLRTPLKAVCQHLLRVMD